MSIESTEATKSGVDGVQSVCGGHNDDVGAGLETVHESQELRDDTTLDFTIGLYIHD